MFYAFFPLPHRIHRLMKLYDEFYFESTLILPDFDMYSVCFRRILILFEKLATNDV